MLTALGLEFGMKAVVDEGVQVLAGDEVDGPAVATVAAARPAPGDELLAPESDTPAPAVSGSYAGVDFVNKHPALR